MLLDIHTLYLAQEGSQAAADIVSNALELTEATIESWNEVWTEVITPESQLWDSVLDTARLTLAFAFIYMFVRYGNEVMKSKYLGTIAEMFTLPLIVLFFLGGNGFLLSQVILALRSLGYQLTVTLLQQQVVGYTLEGAVKQFSLNNIGVQRLKQIYSECEGLTGEPFTQCWESKAPEAEAIASNLESAAGDSSIAAQAVGQLVDVFTAIPGIGSLAEAGFEGFTSGGFEGAYVSFLQSSLVPIIQTLLYAIQWAFVNLVEAALLISAVIAPIALALSVLPIAGRPILAWGSGFVGLLLLQLSYNLLVGLVAVVLANTEGNALETSQNLGFLVFLAVFAPAVTTALASYSASSIFTGISNRANSFAAVISGGISTAVRFASLGK